MIDEMLDIASSEAYTGIKNRDGGPFGAVIVDSNGKIVSRGHNMVIVNNDPTAHAEIVAIRKACESLGKHNLSDCILYSSCEPCPMCLSAIIWSNIKTVYFGATRNDAMKAGFRDSDIYDFIAGDNNMLERKYQENISCVDVLEKYRGDLY